MKDSETKYQVECNGIFTFVEEIPIILSDNITKDIDNQFDELFDSLFDSGVFDSEIEKALEQYSPIADGEFSVDTVISNIYGLAHKYIDSLESRIKIVAYATSPNEGTEDFIELNAQLILDRIHEKLNEGKESEQSACYAGSVIERSLQLFVEESSWQAGYIPSYQNVQQANQVETNDLIPAIWYGKKDCPPLRLWTLSENTTEEELAFWHLDDAWYVMAAIIGDYDDWFLFWYFPECGRISPDIDSIRKQCPIEILETDSVESITKKIKDYFTKKAY